jgi:hypothetical protein
MKNILITLGILFFIISCDDKELALEELNLAPELEYFSRTTTQWENVIDSEIVVDSAKVWTEQNNLNYAAVLRSKDFNNNFADLTITSLDNDLTFFINNDLFENSVTVPLDSFAIAVRNLTAQVKRFDIRVKDSWGKEYNGPFEIHYLNNRKPIPSFELIEVNELTNNEYEINATSSQDADSHLGGYIKIFEYTIDGVVVTIPLNKIHHVFSVGTHQIKLRCLDNNDEWSEQISRNLIIN